MLPDEKRYAVVGFYGSLLTCLKLLLMVALGLRSNLLRRKGARGVADEGDLASVSASLPPLMPMKEMGASSPRPTYGLFKRSGGRMR